MIYKNCSYFKINGIYIKIRLGVLYVLYIMETTKHLNNPKYFCCKICDVITYNKKDYLRHLSTDIHKWKHLETNNPSKLKNPFYCKNCDFISSNKKDYIRHLSTNKHKWTQLDMSKSSHPLCCDCGKSYKTRSGLWKHYKSCMNNPDNQANSSPDQDSYSSDKFTTLKETKELHNIMLHQQEQIDQLIPKSGNVYNNQLNINVFLNEQCKDALNIQEFVNSLQIEIEDLSNTKNNSLEQGITDIFSKALNELTIYKRPIHCTDIKRKILYVKDNESWNKENNNDTVKKAINDIVSLQCKSIDKWIQEHPNWSDDETLQQEYLELAKTITSQLDDKQTNKVIKNIADTTHI